MPGVTPCNALSGRPRGWSGVGLGRRQMYVRRSHASRPARGRERSALPRGTARTTAARLAQAAPRHERLFPSLPGRTRRQQSGARDRHVVKAVNCAPRSGSDRPASDSAPRGGCAAYGDTIAEGVRASGLAPARTTEDLVQDQSPELSGCRFEIAEPDGELPQLAGEHPANHIGGPGRIRERRTNEEPAGIIIFNSSGLPMTLARLWSCRIRCADGTRDPPTSQRMHLAAGRAAPLPAGPRTAHGTQPLKPFNSTVRSAGFDPMSPVMRRVIARPA